MRAGKIGEFRKTILRHWKKNGRHDLPWRKMRDPYKILVSEVMLQQTQVPRVLEKYKEFLKKFPTVRALATAPLSEVLKTWNGLGYNRRGKYLHDAAKEIVRKFEGIVPKDVAELRKLPGMGPYTASAVRVFAFDLPDILIETNIRTAYIHHFFELSTEKHGGAPSMPRGDVRDADVIPIATLAAAGQDPRTWHWALMDYGSHLKRSGVRNNSRSTQYAKQPKFEGSLRQARGRVLRVLHEEAAGERVIHRKIRRGTLDISKALAGLSRDGLVEKKKGKWRIKK